MLIAPSDNQANGASPAQCLKLLFENGSILRSEKYSPPAPTLRKPCSITRHKSGFTLVEVLMAAVILTVGFMGLIQAVTISSGMMDQARRQTLAAQILQNEIENLRTVDWATISTLPTSNVLIGAPWNASSSYTFGDLVTSGGNWYRCILANAGQTPPSTNYWRLDPPSYASVLSSDGVAYGGMFTIRRTTSTVTTDLREATFTVTWVVTSSRRDNSGDPVMFTYARVNTAYFGRYGLNLSYQRS